MFNKLNLMPAKKREAQVAKIRSNFVKIGMGIVILLLVVSLHVALSSWWLGGLKTVEKKTEIERKSKEVRAREVEKLEKELRVLQETIRDIKNIRLSQLDVVKLISVISSGIPERSVWIDTLTATGMDKVDLKGYALDNQAFALFVNNMKNSSLIKHVLITKTVNKVQNSMDVVEFVCQVIPENINNLVIDDGEPIRPKRKKR